MEIRIWLDSRTLLHHSLSSTKAEKKSESGYARGQIQNQEADFYKDKDSAGVFSKIRVLNRSSSSIFIIKDTYAYFYSMTVMYLLIKITRWTEKQLVDVLLLVLKDCDTLFLSIFPLMKEVWIWCMTWSNFKELRIRVLIWW